LMTLGALGALGTRGVLVPDDLALIGFDDFDWATLLRPRLTAVAQPTYEIGETAARLVLDRIAGDAGLGPRRVVLKTRLIVRETCGAAGAVDPAERPALQLACRLRGEVLGVDMVDKFPKMTGYVVPSGVRIAGAQAIGPGPSDRVGAIVRAAGDVDVLARSFRLFFHRRVVRHPERSGLVRIGSGLFCHTALRFWNPLEPDPTFPSPVRIRVARNVPHRRPGGPASTGPCSTISFFRGHDGDG